MNTSGTEIAIDARGDDLSFGAALVSRVLQHNWIFLLFVVVLSVHLAHHFLFQHAKVTFVYDSHYYLLTCSQIIDRIVALLQGHYDWGAIGGSEFVRNITRDGPIATGIPAVMLFWLHRDLVATDWRIFVILMSIFQSISACFVGAICQRITGVTWTGIAAGLLFGLYPSSLVASGLYVSEDIVVLLELAFVFCLALAASNVTARLLSGVILGMVCMAKPALIPAVVMATIIGTLFFYPYKKEAFLKRIGLFLSVVAVGVLTILPWSLYTKSAANKLLITTERLPAYNVAVGTDIETDGWNVVPWTLRQRKLCSFKSPSLILIGQWRANTLPMLILTIRKITRLFISPWNIFREAIFGIDARAQQYIHLGVLFLCIFGICTYLLSRNDLRNNQAHLLGALSLIMILGHSSYLIFQAMARYAYTAIPFLIVFAGFGLFYIHKNKLTRKVCIAMATAVLLLVLICKAESFTRIGEPVETVHVIDKGMIVEKHIDMSSASTSTRSLQALLLIDSDRNVADAQIIVNGHSIDKSIWLINNYGSEQYKLLKGFGELSNLMGISILDFRQWRAVPVPINWIDLHGNNVIDVIGGNLATRIFGDSQETRRMLSPRYIAPDFFALSMESMETRIPEAGLAEQISQKSLIKKNAADSFCSLSDSLRIKLALMPSASCQGKNLESKRGMDHCVLKFDPRNCDRQAQDLSCCGVRVSRYLLGHLGGVLNSMDVPELSESSHVEFKVTGQYRVLRGPGKVSISIDALGPGNNEEILAMTPNYIKGDQSWRSFQIDDLLPTRTIGNKLKKIIIGLSAATMVGRSVWC